MSLAGVSVPSSDPTWARAAAQARWGPAQRVCACGGKRRACKTGALHPTQPPLPPTLAAHDGAQLLEHRPRGRVLAPPACFQLQRRVQALPRLPAQGGVQLAQQLARGGLRATLHALLRVRVRQGRVQLLQQAAAAGARLQDVRLPRWGPHGLVQLGQQASIGVRSLWRGLWRGLRWGPHGLVQLGQQACISVRGLWRGM